MAPLVFYGFSLTHSFFRVVPTPMSFSQMVT